MKGAIFAFFGLMLLAGVFADDGNEPNVTDMNKTKPDVLRLKYDLMECRVNAVISLVEYGETSVNMSSGGLAEKLAEDLETLKTYVDAKDRRGFNSFVIGTLKDDVKDAVFYLKDVRKEIAQAGRNSMLAEEGKNYFAQVKDERAECIQQAALAFAETNKGEMYKHIEAMNKTIENLENKSIDTSELEEIRDEAEKNAEDMEDAIESGNGIEVVDTFKEIREKHLHIWARFHIAKLEAILDAIDNEAAVAGYNAELDSINALLADASDKVEVGSRYEPGEFEQVKNDLTQAHAELRNLLKKLRGE